MICNVLATGSSGNCVLVNDFVAIDMGVPYKLIAPFAKGLKLVLLTHIHSDHFNPATLRRLAQDRPTLRFGCCEWLVPPLIMAGVPTHKIDVFTIGEINLYSHLRVEAFPLFHDVENCGYKLDFDGEKVLYATDTGTMEGVEAKDFDLYMIEANHTEAEIQERIRRKVEAGEFIYEYRAAAGHLSKEKADAWLEMNATPGKSKVIYLHEHKEREQC